jgi:hypothetical protein
MKKDKFLILPIALFLIGAIVPSGLAETVLDNRIKQTDDRLVTLPVSTALIIQVSNTVQLDASSAQVNNYPLTLSLAEPIIDRSGAIAAQVGAPVVGRLVATDDGIKIALDSVVMGGRVVKVQASSSIIPTLAATREVVDNESPNFGESVVGAIFGISVNNQPQVEEFQVLQINSGSTYVLSLDTEVSVSLPEQIESQAPATVYYEEYSTDDSSSGSSQADIFSYPGSFDDYFPSDSYGYDTGTSSQVCAQYEAEYARYEAIRNYQNQTAGTLGAQGIYYENAPTPPVRPSGC